MPAAPSGKPVKRGGWLTVDRSTGLVYAAKGYKTADFYRYDMMRDSWAALSPMPYQSGGWPGKPPDKGSSGCCDNANALYITQGNNGLGFWRYHIAEDSWSVLPDVPLGPSGRKVKGGTDMVYVVQDSVGYVYLLKGHRTEFYRFNSRTRSWDTLQNAPAGQKDRWRYGSWLVYDGDSLIYAHKSRYHELWTYDTRAAVWSTSSLAGMPFVSWLGRKKRSRDGGSATWGLNNIYALKGGNTREFWCYRPQEDSWYNRDTMPSFGSTGRKKRVKYGADIVHWGSGILVALKGNKTLETWRYVSRENAHSKPPSRGGISAFEAEGNPMLTVTPNPICTRVATVRLSSPTPGPLTIAVFDIAGRCLSHAKPPRLLAAGSLRLNLRGLSPGIYIIRAEGPGYAAAHKLVLR